MTVGNQERGGYVEWEALRKWANRRRCQPYAKYSLQKRLQGIAVPRGLENHDVLVEAEGWKPPTGKVGHFTYLEHAAWTYISLT